MKKKRRIGRMTAKPKTIKSAMEKEKLRRDRYFRDALAEFDADPFFAEWQANSKQSLNAILKFLARSFGVVEGFELTNRALKQNMQMERAEVNIRDVVDFSKRAGRIAFFDFVLSHNELSADARKLALAMFIAKEFGYEKIAAEQQLERVLNAFAENVKQPPVPPRERKKVERPVRRSISTPKPREPKPQAERPNRKA